MSGRWESRANLLAAEMGLAGVPFLHGNGGAPSTYIHIVHIVLDCTYMRQCKACVSLIEGRACGYDAADAM